MMGHNAMRMRTGFGTGKFAGHGCVEDDYSEESGGKHYDEKGFVRFPHDKIDPDRMTGEVIIVQKGRKNVKQEG